MEIYSRRLAKNVQTKKKKKTTYFLSLIPKNSAKIKMKDGWVGEGVPFKLQGQRTRRDPQRRCGRQAADRLVTMGCDELYGCPGLNQEGHKYGAQHRKAHRALSLALEISAFCCVSAVPKWPTNHWKRG